MGRDALMHIKNSGSSFNVLDTMKFQTAMIATTERKKLLMFSVVSSKDFSSKSTLSKLISPYPNSSRLTPVPPTLFVVDSYQFALFCVHS